MTRWTWASHCELCRSTPMSTNNIWVVLKCTGTKETHQLKRQQQQWSHPIDVTKTQTNRIVIPVLAVLVVAIEFSICLLLFDLLIFWKIYNCLHALAQYARIYLTSRCTRYQPSNIYFLFGAWVCVRQALNANRNRINLKAAKKKMSFSFYTRKMLHTCDAPQTKPMHSQRWVQNAMHTKFELTIMKKRPSPGWQWGWRRQPSTPVCTMHSM